MSAALTLLRCLRDARHGVTLHDKRLAFLLAGYGILGIHRRRLRAAWFRWITTGHPLHLALRVAGHPTRVELRNGNEADYLVACELVRGGYEVPPEPPDRVVDAGANIGLFALHAARHFPDASLVCYEPDPENFALLERNLASNAIDADLHRAGVWSRPGTLYYHARHSHTGFVDEHPPGLAIPCETPLIGPRCWLKLDVEGAEHELLPALLARGDRPAWISMEIHEHAARGEALLTLLRENGYTVTGGEDAAMDCAVVSARLDGTPRP